jgi:secreted trypsin-like serine protease
MNTLLLLCCLLPVAFGRQVSQFIVGGSNANIANHRHQLSLRTSSHICGASLITGTRAVTAAHCIGNAASSYSVLAGTSDRTVTNCATCVLRTCTLATRHPNYSATGNGYPNDIAVLGFASIATNTNVGYITMSTASDGLYAGTSCVITGWGLTTTTGSGTPPAILQQGTMSVMTNTACQATWGTAINANHICITAPTVSSCNGDSGGPLVCGGKLAGATSWGVSNCSPSYPSVYSRVSSFYSWIIAQ